MCKNTTSSSPKLWSIFNKIMIDIYQALHIPAIKYPSLFSIYQILGALSISVPASFAIVSTISIGSRTCHLADVILLAAPTVVRNIVSAEIPFALRNCLNISKPISYAIGRVIPSSVLSSPAQKTKSSS
jgi:hypothetical protein